MNRRGAENAERINHRGAEDAEEEGEEGLVGGKPR